MNKWRQRWYGYTGLHILAALWFPILLFISNARDSFDTEMFEITAMSWPAIIAFLLLLASALVAQFGFLRYAKEHGPSEVSSLDRTSLATAAPS